MAIDLTRYLPAASVDFTIIDACHDVDFVINDFLCILPLLHSKSIVLFHDVHPSLEGHLRSSYIACMYLQKWASMLCTYRTHGGHLEGRRW